MRAVAGVETAEAEVAGGEVELFVIERIVGDVHLAIQPQERSVGVEHGGGIVIKPGGAALEQRRHDGHLEFGGELGESLGGRSGDRLGEVEAVGVLLAAEVLRAEQFLQTDNLRAVAGGFADAPDGLLQILGRVGRAAHLDEADAEGRGREHVSILSYPSRPIRKPRRTSAPAGAAGHRERARSARPRRAPRRAPASLRRRPPPGS